MKINNDFKQNILINSEKNECCLFILNNLRFHCFCQFFLQLLCIFFSANIWCDIKKTSINVFSAICFFKIPFPNINVERTRHAVELSTVRGGNTGVHAGVVRWSIWQLMSGTIDIDVWCWSGGGCFHLAFVDRRI